MSLEKEASMRPCAIAPAMLFATLALVCHRPAHAEDWPSRPVTMVIPFGAGSGIDVLGRLVAPELSKSLGQPIVIENVGGAGGTIGAARVARAVPDGYQFVLGNVGTHAQSQSLYRTRQYDAVADFEPVALIADTPQVLIARADLPVATLPDFITYAKANQAGMQFGSPGVGSAAHLGCVMLNAAIGASVIHVAYRGGGAAMQDLIAGRLDYECPLVALANPFIQAGRVKPLAALTARRSTLLPNLATAAEQGVADFGIETWNAIFLPKGTPSAIVHRLHDAAVATIESATLQARLPQIGAEPPPPDHRSSDYLRALVAREVTRWAAAVKAAGITPE
jgi:tripartite-type tricarboxylate transporter receptor subunit TctC